jgi:hypothetical protein
MAHDAGNEENKLVVDRGLEWGQFRGLGGGHGELPGEADGASTKEWGVGHWLVGSSPSRGIR